MPGYREEPLPPLPGRPVADDEIIVHGPPMSAMDNGMTPRSMPPMMQPAMMPMGPPMGQTPMGHMMPGQMMPDEGPYGHVAMQPMTPPLQMVSDDHIPLAKCRVLYLGSAVPLETATGLEAVQQPLKERYAMNPDSGEVPGIDVRLTAFSSGLQMVYADDPSTVVWFPIQTLHVCAGVKCVTRVDSATGERQSRFVPLDSAEGARSSHPPLFTCIMRRTVGIKVLECHAFLCKSKDSAMALVQSTTHAYQHREGWRDDAPTTPDPRAGNTQAHLVPADPAPQNIEAPPEFFEKPPLQGYYYSSSKDLVKNFNVAGGRRRPPGAGPVPPGMAVMMPPQPGPPMEIPQPVMMAPPPGSELMPAAPMMAGPYGPVPAPPNGYFADWDPYGMDGQVAVFPGGPYPTMIPQNRRNSHHHRSSRRHRRSTRRQKSPSTRDKSPSRRRRSPSPRRQSPPSRRRPSPRRPSPARRPSPPRRQSPPPRRHSPPSRRQSSKKRQSPNRNGYRSSGGDYSYPGGQSEYSDAYTEYSDSDSGSYSSYTYSSSSSEGDSYESRDYERRGHTPTDNNQSRRPHTPPADYDRHGGGRYNDRVDRQPNGDDLELYAPRYTRNMPNRRSAREENPYKSSFNPDIEFRENKDPKREESHRRHKSSRRKENGDHAQPARYPRSDRAFGRSIREEERALGGSGYDEHSRRGGGGDDDSQLNLDMFQRDGSRRPNGRDSNFERLEQSLGYYP